MERFNLRSAIFYFGFGLVLLGIVPGRSPQHSANAASARVDGGLLRSEVPGVAFSLRPDFGSRTIAVKLKDQDPVAVARAEGTEAYKRLMRGARMPSLGRVPERSTWCNLCSSLTPLSVQNYLSFCREVPEVDTVQALLYALRTAAEAHLGRVVCLVNVNLLNTTVTEGHLDRIVDVALSNLGLTRVLESKADACDLALWAEGWYEVPQRIGEPPNALFLIIESSSCGTINLDLPLLDETGSMNIRRHHNVASTVIDAKCLDEDGPASCIASTIQRRRAIREALTSITRPPFGELPWAGQMPTTISRFLVYADAANDAVLQDELLALFGLDLAGASIVQQPIYAVVLGAARQAFFRINDVSYYRTPSTWCCLRSWGKACPSNRQRIDL